MFQYVIGNVIGGENNAVFASFLQVDHFLQYGFQERERQRSFGMQKLTDFRHSLFLQLAQHRAGGSVRKPGLFQKHPDQTGFCLQVGILFGNQAQQFFCVHSFHPDQYT